MNSFSIHMFSLLFRLYMLGAGHNGNYSVLHFQLKQFVSSRIHTIKSKLVLLRTVEQRNDVLRMVIHYFNDSEISIVAKVHLDIRSFMRLQRM